MLAIDLETHLIKKGMLMPKMVCMSVAGKGFPGGKLYLREEGLDLAEKFLRERVALCAHHAPFDFGVLAAERPELLPLIFAAIDRGDIACTKVREMMICNAFGELKFVWDEELEEWKKQQHFTLQNLAWKYLKKYVKKGADTWRLRYNQLDGVPLDLWPADAKKYAIDDSVDDLAIYHHQEAIVAPDRIPGEVGQMQAAWALHLIGAWGVRTDPLAVETFKAELTRDYETQAAICVKAGFVRDAGKKAGSKDTAKIRSAIEKWFKGRLQWFPKGPARTPTGAIATDREQLMTTDHPGLHAVAEANRLQKLLKTYIPVLEQGIDRPITPSYNPIVETYRTSCARPNLQNPPAKGDVRKCFIPREGTVFAFCDYDTLEMRTLAQVCLDLFGKSDIAEAAHAGQDFHVALAADILGFSYDNALYLYEAGDAEMTNARRFSKIGNYGFGGGMGPHAFTDYAKGYGIVVTEEQALALHRGFRKKWSEMPAYFNHCSWLCDSDSPHPELAGLAEKIIFPRSELVRGLVNYTGACNGFFQHLAAMGAKDALYHVVKECYIDAGSPLYGSRPWLFAHDEIGMEIPAAALGPKKTHEAAMRLREVMVTRMKHWCPDVPIDATVVMSRCWLKGAKAVYEKGLLVPSKQEGKKWVHAA
jgi:hypothetical protein